MADHLEELLTEQELNVLQEVSIVKKVVRGNHYLWLRTATMVAMYKETPAGYQYKKSWELNHD